MRKKTLLSTISTLALLAMPTWAMPKPLGGLGDDSVKAPAESPSGSASAAAQAPSDMGIEAPPPSTPSTLVKEDNDAPKKRLLATALEEWKLTAVSEPIITRWGQLAPVIYEGKPAMFKRTDAWDEIYSGEVLAWWNGYGAAKVYAHAANIIIMEYTPNGLSLSKIIKDDNQRDIEATYILCSIIKRLHESQSQAPIPSHLTPLSKYFKYLEDAAPKRKDVLGKANTMAQELLANPTNQIVLHGDLHQGNVMLADDDRRWIAIDPKGMYGESAFDYMVMFYSPGSEFPYEPGRFQRRLEVVLQMSDIKKERLLKWVYAFGAFSIAVGAVDKDEEPRVLNLMASCLNDGKPVPMTAAKVELVKDGEKDPSS